MGVLTQQTLIQSKTEREVMPNVKVQSPTGDLLVNQMRTGAGRRGGLHQQRGRGGRQPPRHPNRHSLAAATAALRRGQGLGTQQLMGRLLDAIQARQSRSAPRCGAFAGPERARNHEPRNRNPKSEILKSETSPGSPVSDFEFRISDLRAQRGRLGVHPRVCADWRAYVGLILAMLLADALHVALAPAANDGQPGDSLCHAAEPDFQQFDGHPVGLGGGAAGVSDVALSLPGAVVARRLLDIPIVLPPLVIGLSLLILFQTQVGRALEKVIPITFAVPSVVLAQFSVACAFAVRTMRVCFDQIPVRHEQVALTLGCSRARAFWWVVLPKRGAASSPPSP